MTVIVVTGALNADVVHVHILSVWFSCAVFTKGSSPSTIARVESETQAEVHTEYNTHMCLIT